MSNQPTRKPVTHLRSTLVKKVFSKDGTAIAFNRFGDGSPVILVDGALCYRAFGSSRPLAKLLAQHFTVFTYDRRGRGDSGDTAPYAVEREVEDIEALVNEAGGAATRRWKKLRHATKKQRASATLPLESSVPISRTRSSK